MNYKFHQQKPNTEDFGRPPIYTSSTQIMELDTKWDWERKISGSFLKIS